MAELEPIPGRFAVAAAGCVALLLSGGCTEPDAERTARPTAAAALPSGAAGSPGAQTATGGSSTMPSPPGSEVTAPAGLTPKPDTTSQNEDTLSPQEDAGSQKVDAGVALEGDRCAVGVLDPATPPRVLELRGDLGAHDPVVIASGDLYHYFSTGDGIATKTSSDLLTWTQRAEVFPVTPAWFRESVPAYEPRNIWAPDIAFFGGQYHLYYSVSSFGSNRSCIGHATRESLDAGSWTDHEAMFCSNVAGSGDDYNAIDPNVVLDEGGVPWLAFGSFWSGIKMIRLSPSGEREGTERIELASRGGGAIEAPFIVRRCGYYYLFVSFDSCCRGADSTYELRVGRSVTVQGPYEDRAGTPLLEGGGTLLLQGAGEWVGPGHNAVLFDGSRAYNIYHTYAASTGAARLRIAELVWDAEGWPLSGGP